MERSIWHALKALLLMLLLCVGSGAKSITPMERSVVQIQAFSDQWKVLGTGVVVDTWELSGILTAAHVADSTLPLRACYNEQCVALHGHQNIGGPLDDWSVFPVEPPPGTKKARVRFTPVSAGEPITCIGYPFGRYWVSTGVVAATTPELLYADLHIAPGSSGGPVFDSHSRLIGIVSALEIREDRVNRLPTMMYWRSIITPVLDIWTLGSEPPTLIADTLEDL